MSPVDSPGRGHNGGPPLDQPDARGRGYCKHCRHWSPPPDSERRAYESFQLGLSRRRVRRPTGACDRVLLAPGRPASFSATSADFGCLNFEAKPPSPVPVGVRFVTIWEGDRILWRGSEDEIPPEYRD